MPNRLSEALQLVVELLAKRNAEVLENARDNSHSLEEYETMRSHLAQHSYTNGMVSILTNGTFMEGRNGSTIGVFGLRESYNLNEGFPALSAKKLPFKTAKAEMDWFLSGNSSVKELHEKNIHIWDEWMKEDGSIGPAYGYQWRNFNGSGYDQWEQIITDILNEDRSAKRRLIMTAWNPQQLSDMALPPCHAFTQFNWTDLGTGDNNQRYVKIDCQMYQRSADYFLGVPFNIAGYAYLTHLLVETLNMRLGDQDPRKFVVGEFTHVMGDAHIYENHFFAVTEYLEKAAVRIMLGKPDFSGWLDENMELIGHEVGDFIKAPISK